MGALDTKKKQYEDMIQSMNPENMSLYLMLKEKNSQITTVRKFACNIVLLV